MAKGVRWYLDKVGSRCGVLSDSQRAVNQRNITMYGQYINGESVSSIAIEHGLSQQSVYSIFKRLRRVANL